MKLNRYKKQIHVEECALSDKPGTATLKLTLEYNKNQIVDKPGTSGNYVEVDILTVEQYIQNKGYELADLNVVRMDIQGYEYHVLKGMENIIKNNGTLLAFVETHKWIADEQREWIFNIFEKNRYQIISAVRDNDTVENNWKALETTRKDYSLSSEIIER